MSRLSALLSSLCIAVASLSIISCQTNPELNAARAEMLTLQTRKGQLNYPEQSYEYFVSHNKYPVTMSIYKNAALMAKANRTSRIVICLAQQRGRLYVDNQVAADWPVSTGIPGRETPAGNYTVREKKESYASNRYGKMYNAEGKVISTDADAFKHEVPEGGKFVGSPMPYWQRLTGDGIGMHIGKVSAGRRLSHGCIRTPGEMARILYRITGVGTTKVSVNKEIEPEYPAREALSLGTIRQDIDSKMEKLQKKIDTLTREEEEKKKNRSFGISSLLWWR